MTCSAVDAACCQFAQEVCIADHNNRRCSNFGSSQGGTMATPACTAATPDLAGVGGGGYTVGLAMVITSHISQRSLVFPTIRMTVHSIC